MSNQSNIDQISDLFSSPTDENFLQNYCNSTTFWNSTILNVNLSFQYNTTIPTCFEHTLIPLPMVLILLFLCVPSLFLARKIKTKPYFLKNKFKYSKFYLTKVAINVILVINFLTLYRKIKSQCLENDGKCIHIQQTCFTADHYTPLIYAAIFAISLSAEVILHYFEAKRSVFLFIFWSATMTSSLVLTGHKYLMGGHIFKTDYSPFYLVYCSCSCFIFLLHCFSEPADITTYRSNHCDIDDCKITFCRTNSTETSEDPENKALLPQKITYNFRPVEDDNLSKPPMMIPYMNCGVLSFLFFNWYSKIVSLCQNNTVKEADLWSINPTLSCKYATEKLLENIDSGDLDRIMKNRDQDQPREENSNNKKPFFNFIYLAVIKKWWKSILLDKLLWYLELTLTYLSPQIIKRIIDFASSEEPQSSGIFYVGLLFALSIGIHLLYTHRFLRQRVLYNKIKSAISGIMFRKSLLLSSKSRSENSISQMVTFMTTDIHNACEPFWIWEDFLSAPIILAITLYYINSELGFTPTMVLVVAILIIMPASYIASQYYEKNQIKLINKRQERIAKTNELLSGNQVIKLYAWEEAFKTVIQKIRSSEISKIINKIRFDLFFTFIWDLIPVCMTAVGFALYIYTGTEQEPHILTASKAFVTLQYINMLHRPMDRMPTIISKIKEIKVSLKRITKFFHLENINLKNVERIKSTGTNDLVLEIEKADFSWHENGFTLQNINLVVKRHELVAIIGPVGSGKSSLINAILGEMTKVNHGQNNTFYSKSLNAHLSYTPQTAWINNMTLQENIIFSTKYNKPKYDQVIYNCALSNDIDILPSGDQTEIGEKAINLSGGQKQRVSLARSVYREADLYLFDDPLSAVDTHVGNHIFENILSNDTGMLRGKCRILATNAMQYVPLCDKVVIVENGRISYQGTYEELISNEGASTIMHQLGAIESDKRRKEREEKERILAEQKEKEQLEESSNVIPEKQPIVEEKVTKKLIEKELVNERSTSLDSLKLWFKAMGKVRCSAFILINVLTRGGSFGRDFVLKKLTDREIAMNWFRGFAIKFLFSKKTIRVRL